MPRAMCASSAGGGSGMTSVDSNIVFSALSPVDVNHARARRLLSVAAEGGLVISPVVYAELMASTDREGIEAFLELAGIVVLWNTPPEVWRRAGIAFGEYAKKRRKGRLPRRLIADFLIAAHAEYHALGVLTFDPMVYRAVFPGVSVTP